MLQSHDFQPYNNSLNEDKNGAVEIDMGEVRTLDPSGEGMPALLHPDNKAEIKVNGTVITDVHPVHSSDVVEIFPLDEEYPGELDVEVQEDYMKCWVRVTPRIVIKRRLQDISWQHEVKLSWKEETEEFKEVTAGDILQALWEKGVVFGIDYSSLREASENADGRWYLAAQGKEPQEGWDGYVEVLVETEIVPVSFHNGDLMRVDLRERVNIPAVEEGDVLAVVHLPREGIPGENIIGEVLYPQPVKQRQVECREGCKFDERNKKVIALRAGKPAIAGSNNEVFSVVPVHVHHGNVDMKSGNLRFSGGLVVTGSVEENMRVECQGELEVKGRVTGSVLKTEGTAVVRESLINTTLLAGISSKFYLNVLYYLEETEKELYNLINIVNKVSTELAQQKGNKITAEEMRKLVALVVQRKCPELPPLVRNVQECLNKEELSHSPQLEKGIKRFCAEAKDICDNGVYHISFLEALWKDADAKIQHIKSIKEVRGDVIARYVQNCYISANGDIIIQEKGSYFSTLDSGGNIHVNGVFRGGAITAQGEVYIKEVGSPASIQTKIHLSMDSVLKMDKVYENTIVYFNKYCYKFNDDERGVKVYYSSKEDRVKVFYY